MCMRFNALSRTALIHRRRRHDHFFYFVFSFSHSKSRYRLRMRVCAHKPLATLCRVEAQYLDAAVMNEHMPFQKQQFISFESYKLFNDVPMKVKMVLHRVHPPLCISLYPSSSLIRARLVALFISLLRARCSYEYTMSYTMFIVCSKRAQLPTDTVVWPAIDFFLNTRHDTTRNDSKFYGRRHQTLSEKQKTHRSVRCDKEEERHEHWALKQ